MFTKSVENKTAKKKIIRNSRLKERLFLSIPTDKTSNFESFQLFLQLVSLNFVERPAQNVVIEMNMKCVVV